MTSQTTSAGDSLRRVLGLIRKEAWQILRDPSSILIAVVLPLMLLFLFGYGVSFDARKIPVGLVVEQPSSAAGSLTAALRASPFFVLRTAEDRRDFAADLVAGRIDGIVVLPSDFDARLSSGRAAPVQVIVDGSDPNTANLVRNYLQGVWQGWLAQDAADRGAAAAAPVVTVPRVWFNPERNSRYYLVPGSIAIILTLIGGLLTALVVAREWERGTMEALLATPATKTEMLLGKMLPYFALGMGSMVLAVATAVLLFGVPFRGSFPLLALVCAIFLWAALGQGFLISTVMRNQLAASQASLLSAFLPAMFFSGFAFEIASMPAPLRLLSYAVPARYFVSSLQTLFLAGDVWSVIAPAIGAMALVGVAFTTLTFRLTRIRLDGS